MTILTMKGIRKTYRTKHQVVEALKGIDFTLEEGSSTAIMGTSGSGKTTLLNIIGLLDNEFSGDYIIRDESIKNKTELELAKLRNETFGFVVQNFALIEDNSVFENVRIPLEYNRMKVFTNKEQKEKVQSILKDLNILDKYKEKVKNLSGGQKQRVAIARALVNDPDILLADEPTGSLDKNTSKEIMGLLTEQGKTLIIVTHDLEIANQCERIVKLEDGMIDNERV